MFIVNVTYQLESEDVDELWSDCNTGIIPRVGDTVIIKDDDDDHDGKDVEYRVTRVIYQPDYGVGVTTEMTITVKVVVW